MLSAAKSFRLAFRRASVGKSPTGSSLDRKLGDDDGYNHRDASTTREPSENQVCESERDIELLYAKLRRVLEKPRFSRLSAATRARVLERLAKEERPESQAVESLRPTPRDRAQSTMVSERSVTYWDDPSDPPETAESETEVDDLVSVAQVRPLSEVEPLEDDSTHDAAHSEVGELKDSHRRIHGVGSAHQTLASVGRDAQADDSTDPSTRISSMPSKLSGAVAHDDKVMKLVVHPSTTPCFDHDPSSVVPLSVAIGALRCVPFLEACTDEQLTQLRDSEGCSLRQLVRGEEIIVDLDGAGMLVVVVDGVVSVGKRALVPGGRGPAPSTVSNQLQLLSAPAYVLGWRQDDQPINEGRKKVLLAESIMLCLIIPKSAIQERLDDTTALLGGHHARTLHSSSSLRRFASDFVQLLTDDTNQQTNLQLQFMKAESTEVEAEVVLGRMLRIVEDRLGSSSVALFVIDPRTNRMTRLQATRDTSVVTDLPICGVAGLTARTREIQNVSDPLADDRLISSVDVSTEISFTSVPVTVQACPAGRGDPAEVTCVFQFITTSSEFTCRLSPDDTRIIETATNHICNFLRSQWSDRAEDNCVEGAAEAVSVSVASVRVPISALPTISAPTALIATVSMKVYHGEDELIPRTSVVSSRALLDEDVGFVVFEFSETLLVPDDIMLDSMPLATRVVFEMSLSSKSAATSSYLRRRSTMFQSFSSAVANNAGAATQRQHAATSRSSISMSQSQTEAEDSPTRFDSSPTTSTAGRDTFLTGWSGFFLYGQGRKVKSGEFSLGLWTESKNVSAAVCQSGFEDPESLSVLQVCVRVTDASIISTSRSQLKVSPIARAEQIAHTASQQEHEDGHEDVTLASLKARLLIDPFYRLTHLERELAWSARHSLRSDPRMLPMLLLAVDWKNVHAVTEIYELLEDVEVLDPPELALRLLGPKFPDPRVREFAVRCLDGLEEPQDVGLLMMQLVHALQYERFHDSALARFLLRKALTFPGTLGHQLYWLLRADMHQPKVRERYKVILDIYLAHTSQSERVKLRHQYQVIKQLEDIHTQVSQSSSLEDKQAVLVAGLRGMRLPSDFVLPLDPSRKLNGITINECRVLGSKKKPFYLVFNVVEDESSSTYPRGPRTLHVLFKSGDDLRQDQLVLQLFRVMNRVWSRAGSCHQMQLIPYGCVSTGPTSGMIEVVREAETIANVFSMKTQRACGSQRGSAHHKFQSALSVLTEQDALIEWLMLHSLPPASVSEQKKFQKLHRASLSERQIAPQMTQANSRGLVIERLKEGGQDRMHYDDAVRNFATSCAASCIASYVLGIGDRHNDNIMVSRQGHLFHIDFGHILGNFKKKFGVKRERTMFVFTPAFAAVLMSESEVQSNVSAPETTPAPSDDEEKERDIVKKRETTFLKHLKHTRHSRSCHLEAPIDGEQCQDTRVAKSSGISETSVDAASPVDRRQVWQRSIHASLRFSPRHPSRLDQSVDPKRRDSMRHTLQRVPAYELFTQLCCDGYNALRHHVDLLYDLCMLMTGGSLPELQHESDLEWLRAQLLLGEPDDKASAHFLKLIKHSVVSRATLLNDAAHMLKHG